MYNFSRCKKCNNIRCWWIGLNRNEASKKEFIKREQRKQFAHCKKFKS